ncbi:MAG: MBL fold metallo-hydrolase [Candidatus Pacebacteria bacterium]|nr:MBL fold metallo-hydrolase [Candidatus Paceibacterota bacterium]
MSEKHSKLTFYGGTGIVTGANFLLEIDGENGKSLRILVDCGFVQGGSDSHTLNAKAFPYEPNSIDILFVTHAHLDHVGKIPKLVKDGFKGIIYSTRTTRELAQVIMEDSARLLLKDAGNNPKKVIYNEEDILSAMRLWKDIPYHTKTDIGFGVSVYLKDAGHILGSAMYEFSRSGRNIVFTGDLGNSPDLLLPDTEKITDANYLLMESVYGDRNHESKEDRKQKFVQIVKDNIARKGVLVIPAFSLERTQIVLYELDEMVEQKLIPSIPVFLDSPMAIRVTEIYRKEMPNGFNDTIKKDIESGDDIFSFPNLKYTLTTDESKAILGSPNPKIIIAGSGMSNGGRVIHHEKNYLPDPNNTLLMMGYEAVGTLGRTLMDGAKSVNIYGENVAVRAKVANIQGYSAHKDSDHLIEFVEDTKDTVEKVFCVMGEPKSSLFLVQRLRDYVGVNAMMPKLGESFDLNF